MFTRGWINVIALGGLIAAASAHAQTNDRSGVRVETPSVEEQTSPKPENGQQKPPQLSIPVRIIEDPIEAYRARDREQKSDQHDADDLEAQQRSAVAAERTATAAEWQIVQAWWQIAFAVIGTAALIVTLWLTRRSVKAAELAASAAVASNKQTARHLRTLERAYLFGGPKGIVPHIPSQRLTVGFYVQNVGRTPAFLKRVIGDFSDAVPFGEPSYEETERTILKTDLVIEGQSDGINIKLNFESRLLNQTYFFGYIEYLDVFKTPHVSRFCFLIHGNVGKYEIAGPPAWNDWT